MGDTFVFMLFIVRLSHFFFFFFLDLEVISGIPAEVPHLRERAIGEGRHLCFQLVSPSGTAVSTLSYINRTNHLAVGFSDGYLALWNMKSMKRE